MDETAACAEFCETHGFPGPAAALRALGEGRGRFYLVRALMPPEEADFYGFGIDDIAPTERKVFLDRASAERHARRLTVRALRNFAPVQPYSRNPSDLPEADYRCRVGEILGTPYEFPDQPGARAFPESATDNQLWAVAQLVNTPLFDVAEFGAEAGRPGGTWLAIAEARPVTEMEDSWPDEPSDPEP
jgi:hypothetical protein